MKIFLTETITHKYEITTTNFTDDSFEIMRKEIEAGRLKTPEDIYAKVDKLGGKIIECKQL